MVKVNCKEHGIQDAIIVGQKLFCSECISRIFYVRAEVLEEYIETPV